MHELICFLLSPPFSSLTDDLGVHVRYELCVCVLLCIEYVNLVVYGVNKNKLKKEIGNKQSIFLCIAMQIMLHNLEKIMKQKICK